MSENLAGVTLLAFGNGSADIFASLANPQGDTALMYSELFGAAVFVTGIIVGIVIITRPFKVNIRTYIRDVTFFSCSAITVSYFMDDNIYSITEGCITIAMYLCYLSIVIVDHVLIRRKLSERVSLLKIEIVPNPYRIVVSPPPPPGPSLSEPILEMMEQLDEMELTIRHRKDPSIILDSCVNAIFTYDDKVGPNKRLLRKFFRSITPIEMDTWRASRWYEKMMLILKV